MSEIKGPQVLRTPPLARWEFEHRWGVSLGDSTTLRVDRVDGGLLRIAYGSDSIEIRRDLVAAVAEMVAAAAEWTDTEAAR